MKVLIVFAHPERQSFNGAMVDAAVAALEAAGHTVVVSDLYRMGFDPVSSRANFTSVKDPDYLKLQIEEMHATEVGGFSPEVEAEIEKVEACDLMIFQFPLWWFGLPAILKGWVDRVMAMGRTYGGGRFYATGPFQGKNALLSVTIGGPPENYRKGGFNGDITAILRPIHRGILQFLGFEVLAPELHHGPARATPEQRSAWLAAWQARLAAIGQESPYDVGPY
ncbi:NAD(P)H-dependent oxidoreductase [Zavarzinia sp.]|uniref:NAD(P)H-dependent oxidoreductase n=1 Tax=Zavarzinia sp. TaxID=2027920 RepID=UPI0035653353